MSEGGKEGGREKEGERVREERGKREEKKREERTGGGERETELGSQLDIDFAASQHDGRTYPMPFPGIKPNPTDAPHPCTDRFK